MENQLFRQVAGKLKSSNMSLVSSTTIGDTNKHRY
jgi:hypothetical protein